MEVKKINRMFLGLILLHIFVVVLTVAVPYIFGNSIIWSLLLGQSIVVIPGILYVVVYCMGRGGRTEDETVSPDPPSKRFLFCKVKPTTLLMTILFVYLLMPLTTLVNAISMIFVENTVLGISGDVIQMPFWLMFFLMAVVAPFFEEFVFRGVVYGGYRKEGGFAAIIISGLLFGLMHMNLNQALYALVIGIAFAFLVEAAGSIWPSILCHFIFNAQSVIVMYVVNRLMPGFYNTAQQQVTEGSLYLTIGVYFILAAFTSVLAAFVLYWIAGNEGRRSCLKKALPSIKTKWSKLITPALVLAVSLSIAYMVLVEIISRVF